MLIVCVTIASVHLHPWCFVGGHQTGCHWDLCSEFTPLLQCVIEQSPWQQQNQTGRRICCKCIRARAYRHTVVLQHLCKSTQLGHKPRCGTIKGSVFTSTCCTERRESVYTTTIVVLGSAELTCKGVAEAMDVHILLCTYVGLSPR